MENQQKNQKSRFSDGSRMASGGMYSEKVAPEGAAQKPAVKKKPVQPKAAPADVKKPEAAHKPRAKGKARTNKARKARRKVNIKKLLIAILAVIITAAVAGGVFWAVHAYKNRTVHMLPEITDIETEGEFAAEEVGA